MQTVPVEIGPVMALLLMLASESYAATYYVATDGAASNDGSSARPWPSVNHALAQVGGGHVIGFEPWDLRAVGPRPLRAVTKQD